MFREMCYLCSQRAERNVPVYTRKAEEAADREAAKTLVNAQQRNAEIQIQAESKLQSQKRVANKEVAAYNLGASFATREKKLDEEKHKLPHVNYELLTLPNLVFTRFFVHLCNFDFQFIFQSFKFLKVLNF